LRIAVLDKTTEFRVQHSKGFDSLQSILSTFYANIFAPKKLQNQNITREKLRKSL